jgi:ribosomal protein S18 acetylase RimI-like enzyme
LPLVKKDFKDLAGLIRSASIGFDFVNNDFLEAQTFSDPDCDSSYLIKAVEKKQLIGAGIAVARKLEGNKLGFVKYIGVLPKFRRKGTGQAIFSELERRFQKREAREVRVGSCPAPFFQGGVDVTDTALVALLLKRGYQRQGEIVDMTLSLGKWEALELPEDKARLKEFGIRKAAPKDEAALEEMIQVEFPQWVQELRVGLKRGVVWMAGQEGRAIAFCGVNLSNPGYLGPVGVREAFRGRGIGRLLLNKCLEGVKKSGLKSLRIPGLGPIPFFSKYAGAHLGPIFWCYSKKV